jgi:hypothetical protein
MAYRQAGMFVGWLHDRDRRAFAALLDRIFAGDDFRTAFEASQPTSIAVAWRDFAAAQKPAK